MTISLLLVVMRILTVTTRYKLEIFPVSGAPAAQQAWGCTDLSSQLSYQPQAMSQCGTPKHCQSWKCP